MKGLKCIMLLSLVSFLFILFSCSKDNYSSPPKIAGAITTYDGTTVLLKKLSWNKYEYITYQYDESGRPTKISDSGDPCFEISYDPYKIVLGGDDDIKVSASFTSAGYVSKISMSYTYKESDYSESVSASMSCSYDSDNHLTGWTNSYSSSEKEDGESYSVSGKYTANLTWTDGNLIKVTYSDTYGDNDGSYKDSGTITYEYGDVVNEYLQPTDAWTWGFPYYYQLAYIGYFGVGTTNLPKSFDENDDDGYTYSRTCSYTKNDDGTINTENGCTYSYYTLNDDSGYAKPDTPNVEGSSTRSGDSLSGNEMHGLVEADHLINIFGSQHIRERIEAHRAKHNK